MDKDWPSGSSVTPQQVFRQPLIEQEEVGKLRKKIMQVVITTPQIGLGKEIHLGPSNLIVEEACPGKKNLWRKRRRNDAFIFLPLPCEVL
jgi:hypothetical protein